MKVGVVTFFTNNYGALLQCYALQHVLRDLGFDSEIINRRWGHYLPIKGKFDFIKKHIFIDYFQRFRQENLPLSQPVTCKQDLIDLEKEYDIIIVGSDQVWNIDCIKEMGLYYYLDWVSPNTKKYSYATSFGKDSFDVDEETKKEISTILKGYDGISVRESSGVNICNEIFQVKAFHHLDPTLLLEAEDYKKLIKANKKSASQICKYFLDYTSNKETIADEIAEYLSCSIIDNYPHKRNKYKALFSANYRLPSVPEWLGNMASSRFVVTDSFHGMIFALIFRKQFIVINNKRRGSARFESLLMQIGLRERLLDIEDVSFEAIKTIIDDIINYDELNRKLDILKKHSKNYLNKLI